ncbi:MAG: TadE/TadG family type IV pilus assembly protein [Paracoccaceae bacterium]
MTRLRGLFARWRGDQRGSSTIEFVILFPAFVVLLLSGYEIGVLMVRQTMLERGVDLAVRDLRLGIMSGGADDIVDESDVRRAICDYAGVLPDCMNAMHLDLQPISNITFAMPAPQATCVDRTSTIRPDILFNAGQENELMIVRACYVVDPLFPTSGLGAQLTLDDSGGYQLVSTSAFVNEPQ